MGNQSVQTRPLLQLQMIFVCERSIGRVVTMPFRTQWQYFVHAAIMIALTLLDH
jgi:hypothetical protein